MLTPNSMTSEIPARILRAEAIDREPALNDLNQRERLQRERILHHAPAMFLRHGRAAISFRNLAVALKMAPTTLRKHFADLDALLAKILTDYLLTLSRTLGEVPHDLPDRRLGTRAAYLAATRGPFGGHTEEHALFLRERHTLPPDLRANIDDLHFLIGSHCAGDLAGKALALLDCPWFEAAEIETTLASYATPPAAEPPSPPAEPIKPMPRQSFARPPDIDDEFDSDLSRISGVTIPLAGILGPGGGRPAYMAEPATGHA